MKKIHVAAIALLLAFAAVLGTFAATRTASLGSASRQAATRVVRRTGQAAQRVLGEASEGARRKACTADAPAGARVAPRIVYRRPPAIVVVKHTHHGDDGFERAEGGGGDD